MAGHSNSSVAKIVYRALLRWARANADVPLTLRSTEVATVVPNLNATTPAISLNSSRAVAALAKIAFRTNSTLTGAVAHSAVDRALDALRLLNSHYAAVIADMRAIRADRSNRDGVAFQVGQVFVHRKFGYRAVVYGWDHKCERDDDWVKTMGTNAQLPHYYALPDENDCIKYFGGVRLSKYVCEDNMLPVEGVAVVHRALENYFIGFCDKLKRYVPNERLQFEYPGTYTVDEGETERSGGGGGGSSGDRLIIEVDSNVCVEPRESEVSVLHRTAPPR